MTERTQVTVQDNPVEHRYDALVEGDLAGFAEYVDKDGIRVFTHTEVDDAYEGKGVGSALARGALDDVRGNGGLVRPKCEFIRSYIDRHDEYADLVV